MQMLPSAAQRYRLGIAFSSSLREYKVFHMFALAAAKEQIITTQSAHVTNEPSLRCPCCHEQRRNTGYESAGLHRLSNPVYPFRLAQFSPARSAVPFALIRAHCF